MLSAEALSFRQQSRLAISLSWIGGFTNVFAFLTWKTFSSHMTGSTTLLGLNLALREWSEALLFFTLVASFLAGAISSTVMTELSRRHGVLSKYMLPLTVEALLLTLVMLSVRLHPEVSKGLPEYGLLGLTAYAMGLQNATITRISGAVVRSTHLTGVLTDFGIESVQFGLWAWDQLQGRMWQRAGRVLKVSQRHPSLLRIALLASIWGSFVFGVIIGVFTYEKLHERALLLPVGFLLFITVFDWRRPIADIRELDPLHDPELKLFGLVYSLLPTPVGLYRLTHDRRQRFRAPNFSFWIDNLPPQKQVVILAIPPVMQFDANSIADLHRAVTKLESSHRRLIIAGVTPVQYRRLAHEHLVERIGAENICPDLEFAIALGNDLVRTPNAARS
ncbi:MAG TPA: YoaK family protein [Phycisphaerae bacterium]|nr:YoaK family protein [Phycisphaerae bacterium]